MSELLARYSLREKMIVIAALLVVVVLGGHSQIIEPYLMRSAELQDEINQQRADLAWMKSAVVNMPVAMSAPTTVEIEGTLANYVDQAVRRQGLSAQLTQMSPIGADEIRMRYSAVDFNRLVGFIAEVSSSGLNVKDMRISPSDIPGIVDSNIVLERR